jgi:hypothetical protein
MHPKTRIKAQHFMDGSKKVGDTTAISSAYIVEVCVERRWLPLGDNGRITRFATREAAQKAADELASQEVTVQ